MIKFNPFLTLGFALLLFTSNLFAVCNDTGSNWNAYDGGAQSGTWRYWDSSNNSMSNHVACITIDPTCFQADTGGPCNGCGYQNPRQSNSCFSNNECDAFCSPVPELPSLDFLIPIFYKTGDLFRTLYNKVF